MAKNLEKAEMPEKWFNESFTPNLAQHNFLVYYYITLFSMIR